MLVYATEDDLSGWLTDAGLDMPTNPVGDLRSAALIVARAVGESLYTEGLTTSPPKRDATCAQVASWLASGVTPGTGGLAGPGVAAPLKRAGTDGSIVEYDTSLSSSAAALAVRGKLTDDLCAEAREILQQAGLLYLPLAAVTCEPVSPYRSPYLRPMYGDGFGWGSYGPAGYGTDGEPYYPGGTF